MDNSPSDVSAKQLKEIHIDVIIPPVAKEEPKKPQEKK